MEKTRGFFGEFWHLTFLILKYLVILGVILVCLLLYFTHKQKQAGQDWCEQMIAGYEADKSRFVEENRQNTADGMVYVPIGSAAKNTMARFTLHANGDYECSYAHGGLTGPHDYKHESKTDLE
jgi:hypothetical protein